jgi:hypothetical protein
VGKDSAKKLDLMLKNELFYRKKKNYVFDVGLSGPKRRKSINHRLKLKQMSRSTSSRQEDSQHVLISKMAEMKKEDLKRALDPATIFQRIKQGDPALGKNRFKRVRNIESITVSSRQTGTL